MKRIKPRVLAVSIALMFLAGCTGVEVTPLSGHGHNDTHGFRIYEPHPYLMITLGGAASAAGKAEPTSFSFTAPGTSENVYTASVIYLPDYSRGYAVSINAGFGTNDTTLTIVDGWQLTSVNSKLDSKFAENITAITGLIPALAKVLGAPGAPSGEGIVPGLYRFNFDETTGKFTGLELVKSFSKVAPG